MTKQATDHIARMQAVNPHHSYIVQAPAGSGKTELLTDRILSLLAIVNRPEDILAITFTRKAAAEMKDRVMKKLEQARSNEQPVPEHQQDSREKALAVLQRDSELNWSLLDNPSRLRIQTIDSFAQSLVRMTPSLSGAGAGLSPQESAESLHRKAVQKTFSQLDTQESVRVVLSHLDVEVEKFHSLLVQMLDKRQGWIALAQEPALALTKMMETLNNIIEQNLKHLDTLLPVGWFSYLSPILPEAAQTLHQYLLDKGKDPKENSLKIFKQWSGEPFTHSIDDIEKWQALCFFLATNDGPIRRDLRVTSGIAPKAPFKKGLVEWFETLDERLVDVISDVKSLPTQLIDAENITLFQHFFECLLQCEHNLQKVFQEEGVVDFTEISQRALRALGSQEAPTEMLLKIDADLKHILIDEFQDTSFAQKELLDLITSGWSVGDGRTLFLVGDPMQSIYRFRNAEVSLFLTLAEKAAKNTGLPEAEKQVVLGNVVMDLLHLKENFRSDAGVVDWVNHMFKQVFPSDNQPSLGAISYTDSHPFKPAKEANAVQYYPFNFTKQSGDEGKEQALKQAVYKAVALVQNVLEQNKASEKKRTVAVLVRSRTHLEGLAEALNQANIPVQAVKMVPLAQTEEVSDLVQLIRALSHASDRLAWLSLLRAPFCGLTLASLTRLFEGKIERSIPAQMQAYRQTPEALASILSPEEQQRFLFAAQALLDIPYLQSDMTFATYVELVWERLGAARLYASEAAQENVMSVLTIVEELAPYGNLDLREFDQRMAKLFAAPVSEENAVQIMTMHSSKGLEFDEVILFGLHKEPPPNKGDLLEIENEQGHLLMGSITHKAKDIEDPISSIIKRRNRIRQRHEVDRLLYVACTRAKEKLHLMYLRCEDKKPAASTMLSSIEAFIDPTLVVNADDIILEEAPSIWAFESEGVKRFTLDTICSLQKELVSEDKKEETVVSPSEKTAISTEKESNLAEGMPLSEWVFENRLHSAIGTVAHAWLEQMGRAKLQDWSIERVKSGVKLIKRQLHQLGVYPQELEQASSRVIHLLSEVLNDERGQYLLSHPQATQEWQLYNEDNQQRIVDLVLATEEGWLVVDYKTNQRLPNESDEAFKDRLRVLYTSQLQAYADYLSGLDGRAVKTAIYALDGCQWIELL
ncbi:exodeoxyribonuclease V subunit beta [Pelistega sp. MC2]|uniref:UvrD-helicase domain-containing protein n=1 Tax=Pelistega sp. MC2 TaxID=1720297 RepID=UPI0008DA0F00|nr:UvrD-helicase domain-containing protein [Pelistega sp. MC2]